jgi:hypothetical protein
MRSWITGDIFTSQPRPTTLKAWEPWWDTVAILFELQNSDIDDEHPEWRLHWVAGVALLRTVGHVLKKVDAKTSPKHLEAVKAQWSIWNGDKLENWIFFDFIEQERNNILKEYSFGATLPEPNDDRTLVYRDTDFDAAQLFREAVYWWREQLLAIENALQQLPTNLYG